MHNLQGTQLFRTMSSTPKKKRITMKLKHPNPLFEQWLTEWRDRAIETDSKMQHCFGKALQSLRKYPLLLESGRNCKVLQGFGEKLCQMLDKKLQEYKAANPGALERAKANADNNAASSNSTKIAVDLNTSKRAKEYVPVWRSGAYAILLTLYKKSLEPQYPGYMSKPDVIKYGQHLCDKSFVRPDPGSFYTAWSSMKTLLERNLILKKSNPAKFSLTDEGVVLAHKLYRNHLSDQSEDDGPSILHPVDTNINKSRKAPKAKTSVRSGSSSSLETGAPITSISESKKGPKSKRNNSSENMSSGTSCLSNLESVYLDIVDITDTKTLKKGSKPKGNKSKGIQSGASSSSIEPLSQSSADTESTTSSVTHNETFIFNPHSFEIVLLVDKQETAGNTRDALEDSTLAELTYLNVPYEVRHLKVGDYTWVCRQQASNKELILPYIVERKRMDDFGSSIKDGRFHEQKFRLKQSGIQNLVYLIESHGSNTHTGLPLSTLYQAATNTLLQDGFSVKFTDNLRGTMEYLSAFTTILQDNYASKTLVSCPKQNLTSCTIQDDLISLMTFREFNKGASKAREFTVKEMFIRHLLQLKGVSVEKAISIAEKYPTPAVLRDKYMNNPSSGEKLLATLQYGKLGKKVGPVISKAIYQLYTSQKF